MDPDKNANSVVLWLIFLVDTREWGPQKVQQELKMAIPMQGRVSDGPPGAPRRGALTPNRHTAAVSIHTNSVAIQMHDIDFTLGFLFN